MQKLLDDIPAPEALAGEEFSQAWEPSESNVDVKEGGTKHVSENYTVSGTQAASDFVREREELVAQKMSADEIKKKLGASDVYRLKLFYAGVEAEIVKKACGDNPAEQILKWAKQAPASS